MLDFDDAQRIIDEHVGVGPTVKVGLEDALGCVLARDVVCDIDDPPFDRSVMDGYAVRAIDTASPPNSLNVVGQIAAGSKAQADLRTGEAMQINTGAALPTGADAVVRVEETKLIEHGARVRINAQIAPGKFITRQGANARNGQTVLRAGSLMTPLEVGVAAAGGAGKLAVYRKPRVAVLVTGNELVSVDEFPTGSQIRNSNEPMLHALVRESSAQLQPLGIVGDDRFELKKKIKKGLNVDVLCITGGVSMGAYDFVPEVLQSCGVQIEFHKVAIKPGRPMLFGVGATGTIVFALPGNPISAFVCFELLVRPAMRKLAGYAETRRRTTQMRLNGSLPAVANRRAFRPGYAAQLDDGTWEVQPLCWNGSGDIFGMAGANALITQAPESAALQPTDLVAIYPLGATALWST